jgi:hypothetical protein
MPFSLSLYVGGKGWARTGDFQLAEPSEPELERRRNLI